MDQRDTPLTGQECNGRTIHPRPSLQLLLGGMWYEMDLQCSLRGSSNAAFRFLLENLTNNHSSTHHHTRQCASSNALQSRHSPCCLFKQLRSFRYVKAESSKLPCLRLVRSVQKMSSPTLISSLAERGQGPGARRERSARLAVFGPSKYPMEAKKSNVRPKRRKDCDSLPCTCD